MLNSFYKILRLLDPKEKKQFYFLAFLDVLITFLDVFFVAITFLLFNFFTVRKGIDSYGIYTVIDNHRSASMFLFLIAYCGKNMAAYRIVKYQYSYVYKIATRLSEQGLIKYFSSSYEEFLTKNSAGFIRKISHLPIEYGYYLVRNGQLILSQTVLVILSFITLILSDLHLSLLLLLFVGMPVLFMNRQIKNKSRLIRERVQKDGDLAIQYLNEALNGYIEGKFFNAEEYMTRRFVIRQGHLNEFLAGQQSLQYLPGRIIEFFTISGLLLIVYLKSSMAIDQPSIEQFSLFIALAYKLVPGCSRILSAIAQIKTYEPIIKELSPVSENQNNNSLDGELHEIRFEQVEFAWGDRRVLKTTTLHLVKGDFLVIKGISGKGKTTFINLLLGFLKPDIGCIKINNRKWNADTSKFVMGRTSYVKQQDFLMADSPVSNIIMSGKCADQERLQKVATWTGLNEFLPDLHSTIISERGKNISGGQRQRLVLARALYKESDLYVLDEPFSELDTNAEIEMLEKLQELCTQGKMVVLITHNDHADPYATKKMIFEK